jgi:hypothetical protein
MLKQYKRAHLYDLGKNNCLLQMTVLKSLTFWDTLFK